MTKQESIAIDIRDDLTSCIYPYRNTHTHVNIVECDKSFLLLLSNDLIIVDKQMN